MNKQNKILITLGLIVLLLFSISLIIESTLVMFFSIVILIIYSIRTFMVVNYNWDKFIKDPIIDDKTQKTQKMENSKPHQKRTQQHKK